VQIELKEHFTKENPPDVAKIMLHESQ